MDSITAANVALDTLRLVDEQINNPDVVLGVDPGLRLTGYGLLEVRPYPSEPTIVEAGVLRLPTGTSIEARITQLHHELTEVITEHKPAVMAVEKLYAHYRHPRTAILMAHARGVILLAARQQGVQVVPLAATEVKKSITGHGHADKSQVQSAVQSVFRLAQPPSPPDVADALAIALCCVRRRAVT